MNECQQQQKQQQLLLRKSIKIFTHLFYTNVTVITSTHSFVHTLRLRNICNYKRKAVRPSALCKCSVALQHFILFLFCVFVLYFVFFTLLLLLLFRICFMRVAFIFTFCNTQASEMEGS